MGESVNRIAFVRMDELYTIFLLIEDGVPVDCRLTRGNKSFDEFAFFIAAYVEKLGIQSVYCDHNGWHGPLRKRLEEHGVAVAEMARSDDLREADFEACQAHHIYHLRKCAKALQKIEGA